MEIHNTPWGERHCYVLGAEQNEHPIEYWRRHQFAKVFHVSPFIDMDIHYDWRFRLPDDSMRVHMIDYERGEKLFDASLALRRRPINRQALTGVLLRYPVMTGKVISLIYWQALRLFLKRTPVFTHPKKRKLSSERITKMTELIIPSEAPALNELKERKLDHIARKAVLSLLNKLKHGRMTIIEGNQRTPFGEKSPTVSLQTDITVHHVQFYSRILFGGSIGAAEAYMERLWSTDDLTAVMRILALNQQAFADMERGLARLTAPFYKFYHFARKNTKGGSRKNILAHYDLGNDFYALFLDETMTYSCGIFERQDSTLREASEAKYDRICRKLSLPPATGFWKSAPAGAALPCMRPATTGCT